MGSIILTGKSQESLELLLNLAKKLGIKASVLSEEAMEEISMVHAMKKGRTGELVDTERILKDLRK